MAEDKPAEHYYIVKAIHKGRAVESTVKATSSTAAEVKWMAAHPNDTVSSVYLA